MTQIVVTVHEATEEAAKAAIRSATGADAIELRADAFAAPGAPLDLAAFRALTPLPLILTRRGAPFDAGEARRALEAGFDLVDVEMRPDLAPADVAPLRDRAILSFHEFASLPELEPLEARMRAFGTAFVKIAVTPRRFEENAVILRRLEGSDGTLALIGMGEVGLYSRILAPFYGSALAFVAPGEENAAAPGQFSLARARAYWGDGTALARPAALFAVVGNPIGHSLSPAIHNRRFRELGVPAAYSIAQVDRLEDVAEGLAAGRAFHPTGISITAPFKEDAYRFALERGASISARASACGSVNTLVRRVDGTLLADNTDVEGIAAAVRARGGTPARAAVLGVGGSARAAVVALGEFGVEPRVYARNPEHARARSFPAPAIVPLAELAAFDGDLVVNTISAEAVVPYPSALLREGVAIVDLAYTAARLAQLAEARGAGVATADGLAVLEGQAEAQSKLFLLAVPGGAR